MVRVIVNEGVGVGARFDFFFGWSLFTWGFGSNRRLGRSGVV